MKLNLSRLLIIKLPVLIAMQKSMNKKEANSSITFRHWIMANPQHTGAYEMKDTRGKKAFPLKEWKEAQRTFAEAIRYGKKGVLIRTEGVEDLPDYVYLRNEPSFVVIRYPQGFVVISGETLNYEKGTSLSWERAIEISHKVIKLK